VHVLVVCEEMSQHHLVHQMIKPWRLSRDIRYDGLETSLGIALGDKTRDWFPIADLQAALLSKHKYPVLPAFRVLSAHPGAKLSRI
jgi:hypothetical protein